MDVGSVGLKLYASAEELNQENSSTDINEYSDNNSNEEKAEDALLENDANKDEPEKNGKKGELEDETGENSEEIKDTSPDENSGEKGDSSLSENSDEETGASEVEDLNGGADSSENENLDEGTDLSEDKIPEEKINSSEDEKIGEGSEKEGVWDGMVADSYAGGAGTSSEPYLIATAAQLAKVAYDTNYAKTPVEKYYKLIEDIYLNDISNWDSWVFTAPVNNWIPIGNSSHPFQGQFDGDGHVIYGVYINKSEDYQGIFGYNNASKIINLGSEYSYIIGKNCVGGIVGYNNSDGNTTNNCYNTGFVSGTTYVGGIVGDGGAANPTSCYNVGEISGNSYVGGIAGKTMSATNCWNIGTVNGSSYVGGIFGIMDRRYGYFGGNVSKCFNAGAINGTTYIGGIAGYTQPYSGLYQSSTSIRNCYNIGSVTAEGDKAAGIVGYPYNTVVAKCYNAGICNFGSDTESGAIINSGVSSETNGLYYLVGCCGKNYQNSWSQYVTEMSAGEMREDNFVGTLNNGGSIWLQDTEKYNFGYPILKGIDYEVYASYQMPSDLNMCCYITVLDMKTQQPIENVQVVAEDNVLVGHTDSTGTMFLSDLASIFFTEVPLFFLKSGYETIICNYNDLEADNFLNCPTNYVYMILDGEEVGIVEAVERYTSDKEVKEVIEIFNSTVSDEEKRQLLFEYYNYDNMLDVRERLVQLSNMHDERWDYEGLIRDDMYLSWQYYNYLNNTPKGIAARTCLYVSGLVFNNELGEWIDPSTYWDGDYPGVEKYKSMLKEFIQTQSTSIELYSYIKETEKFVNSSVGIWSKIEKGEIIKELNDAPDYTICRTKFNNFIALKINSSEDKTFVFDGDKPVLMKAMDETKNLFKISNIAVNTISEFMDVSCNLKIYETYHNFLMDIYEANDLPWELVVAAYQLDKELEEGYLTPTKNMLKEMRDVCLDKVFDLSKLIGIKDYLTVVSFTSFCINQFVDIGALVVNSCKTEGYAFLAMHYKNKLEQCKQDFLINKTEENAWKFYEAYVMLWELRIAGEKKFLDMSQLEGGTAVDNLQKYASGGTIAGLISDLCGYKDKKAVVDENIKLLSSFEFKYSPKNIPDNLLYLKKVIIECPVNVDFIAADGSLICTLNNKEETLISNDYGEFVCFYRATTGDYVKIAYFNDTTPIIINATCTEIGKVSYTLVETENHETYTTKGFNDVIVDPGDVIQVDVNQSTYTIDKDLDGKADIEGQQADKNRLFVQFDYQDNSFIKVEYVNEKGVVSLPEINAQNGKSFLGWYTEPDGKGEEFTSETIVNKSMTVYAKWKQLEMQKLSIPLANVMSDSTVIKGTKIVLSCSDQDAQIFYTLDGTDPTSDSNKYIDPIVVNEDIVIKAIAVKTGFQNSEIATFNYKIEEAVEEPDINTYAVSFELQGHGVALDEYLNYTKIGAGSRIKEPTAPRDDKYLFTGWYKDADCLNKWNFEVDVVEKNMTLYAGWQSKDLGDLFPDDLPEDGVIPNGLWAAGITDATYTGTAITQSFRLYDSTKRLKEKTDYTVSYKNNKVAYTYTDEDHTAFEQTLADTGKRTRICTFDPVQAPQVIIKMKGNYAGTRIIYFRILSADITEEAFSADDLTVR